VFDTAMLSQFADSQSLGGLMGMHVKKDILVVGGFDTEIFASNGLGGFAQITRVSQNFTTAAPVPEPGAGLLFAAGVGVVAARMRRHSGEQRA
jgi:hypothetical protein